MSCAQYKRQVAVKIRTALEDVQQAIGVFGRSGRQGAMVVSEVGWNWNSCVLGEYFVIAHLAALIVGHVGESTTQAIDIGANGGPERTLRSGYTTFFHG